MNPGANKKRIVRIAVYFAVISVSLIMLIRLNNITSRSTLTDNTGSIKNITIPYFSNSADGKDFIFTTSVNRSLLYPVWIRIIPDDGVTELRVNGKQIPLDIEDKNLLWNWDKGFDFPLGKFLTEKQNTVEFKIHNRGGRYGLRIQPSSRNIIYVMVNVVLVLFVIIFIVELMKLFKINNKLIIISAAAVVVRLMYLSATGWNVRGYDVAEHIEYINYILEKAALPPGSGGWEFHQMPLYYITAALVSKISAFAGIQNNFLVYKILQFYSFIADMFVLIIGFQIIKRVFPAEDTASGSGIPITDSKLRENLAMLSFSLFALWPSHIIHSVRISNDIFYYLFYFLAFLAFMIWFNKPTNKNLVALIVSLVLLFASKKSGIIIVPAMYSAMLLKHILNKGVYNDKRSFLKGCVIITLSLAVLSACIFQEPIRSNISGKHSNILVGETNSNLNSRLFVQNDVQNYLYFDVGMFLTKPFTDPFKDELGRQYFLNYLFKTSLFGEFRFDSSSGKNLGIIISFSFLLMFIYSLIALFLFTKDVFIRMNLLFFNALFLFLSGLVYRIMIPAACNNDFRFIFPILLPAVITYVLSINEFRSRNWKRMYYTGHLLYAVFILSSVLFIILI